MEKVKKGKQNKKKTLIRTDIFTLVHFIIINTITNIVTQYIVLFDLIKGDQIPDEPFLEKKKKKPKPEEGPFPEPFSHTWCVIRCFDFSSSNIVYICI